MKRWIGLGVCAAVLAGGGYYGYQAFFKEEPMLAAQQRTAQAFRGEIAVVVSGSGTVSPVNRADVKAGESGEIAKVHVQEGDTVEAGQLLVEFEPPDVESQIVQKENSLKKQELQMEQLQQNYISASEDDARAKIAGEIESLKLDLASSRSELAELREQQADVVRIVSPIAGKVTTLNAAEGEQVQPDTVIASVVGYDNLQTVIQVDELDIAKVKAGQAAIVTLDAMGGAEIEGEVTKVADEGTASNGVSVFDVTVAFKAEGGVKSGMTTQASVTTDSKEDALLVPIEAVRDAGGSKFVQLADAGDSSGGQEGSAAAPRQPGRAEDTEAPAAGAGPVRPGASDGSAGAGDVPSSRGETGAAGGSGSGTGGRGAFANMRAVEVGLANESYIEIVNGLAEGDVVVLPAIAVASNGNAAVTQGFGGFGGGAFPSNGAFPGGGQRQAGGFAGGGSARP